jgi:hypothetical protein
MMGMKTMSLIHIILCQIVLAILKNRQGDELKFEPL